MPPCFKARFGIKCLIKVPWHVIKHLAKAAFPHGVFCKTAFVQEGGGRARRVQAIPWITWRRGAGFK